MALTRETLIAFLVDTFDVQRDELQDDTPIFSQGLLDSFSLLELVTHLESQGGFKMGAMEVNLDNLDTIERILRFVASKS